VSRSSVRMRITFGGSEAPTTRVGGPQLVASKQTATKAMTAKHVAWRIRRRGLGRLVVACAIGERLYSDPSFQAPEHHEPNYKPVFTRVSRRGVPRSMMRHEAFEGIGK
jgi:hypothetical protein